MGSEVGHSTATVTDTVLASQEDVLIMPTQEVKTQKRQNANPSCSHFKLLAQFENNREEVVSAQEFASKVQAIPGP